MCTNNNITIYEHVWSCTSIKVTPILSLSHIVQAFDTLDVFQVIKNCFNNYVGMQLELICMFVSKFFNFFLDGQYPQVMIDDIIYFELVCCDNNTKGNILTTFNDFDVKFINTI